MATTVQVQKLRRKIQDFYSKRTGQPLGPSEYAFADEELFDIIDDAAAEATDGTANAESMNALQESWCMLIARADAILQIAQDEARRIKWQANQEIVDPSNVAQNLVEVVKALQQRYSEARQRQLTAKIEGISERSTGGMLNFNSTVQPHYQRNFDNSTVRRNTSPDHRY